MALGHWAHPRHVVFQSVVQAAYATTRWKGGRRVVVAQCVRSRSVKRWSRINRLSRRRPQQALFWTVTADARSGKYRDEKVEQCFVVEQKAVAVVGGFEGLAFPPRKWRRVSKRHEEVHRQVGGLFTPCILFLLFVVVVAIGKRRTPCCCKCGLAGAVTAWRLLARSVKNGVGAVAVHRGRVFGGSDSSRRIVPNDCWFNLCRPRIKFRVFTNHQIQKY